MSSDESEIQPSFAGADAMEPELMNLDSNEMPASTEEEVEELVVPSSPQTTPAARTHRERSTPNTISPEDNNMAQAAASAHDANCRAEIARLLPQVRDRATRGLLQVPPPPPPPPPRANVGRNATAQQNLTGKSQGTSMPGATSVSAIPAALLVGEQDAMRTNRTGAAAADIQDGKGSLGRRRMAGRGTDTGNEHQPPDDMVDVTEESTIAENSNLTEAILVVHEDDPFRPVAIEYDPDAKPAQNQNQYYGLYVAKWSTLFLLVFGIAIGLTVFFTHDNGEDPTVNATDLPLGQYIQSYLQSVVGPNQTEVLLDSKSDSPYRKALEWITFQDQGSLDRPIILQRFWAAYFYYATTVQHNWTSCNPPQDDESISCSFVFLDEGYTIPHIGESVRAFRWLSNATECSWAGIACDALGQINKITLCKYMLVCGYVLSIVQGENDVLTTRTNPLLFRNGSQLQSQWKFS